MFKLVHFASRSGHGIADQAVTQRPLEQILSGPHFIPAKTGPVSRAIRFFRVRLRVSSESCSIDFRFESRMEHARPSLEYGICQ
eukprot:1125614-Rhodomonas_salina.6